MKNVEPDSLAETMIYLTRKLRKGNFDKHDAILLAVEAGQKYYEMTQDESFSDAIESSQAVRKFWGEES